jgi:hypothetical protein
VKLKVWPVVRLPLSNAFAKSVAVCGAVSMFVHVTELPTLMVTVAGTNAKFWIATVAAGVVGVGFTFALFDEQL